MGDGSAVGREGQCSVRAASSARSRGRCGPSRVCDREGAEPADCPAGEGGVVGGRGCSWRGAFPPMDGDAGWPVDVRHPPQDICPGHLAARLRDRRGRPPAEAELARTVTALRAQNTAYARKMEELENQVFVLSAELDTRRVGRAARPAEPAAPPAAAGDQAAARARDPASPTWTSPAGSLVDEAVVEYAGAAADERSGKRPVLRLWGPGRPSRGGPAEEVAPERPAARRRPAPAARAAAELRRGRRIARGRGRRRWRSTRAPTITCRPGDTGEAVDGLPRRS